MLSYEEFSSWIEIEGEEAKEYGVQQTKNDKGFPTVTCWIISEAGKQFVVNWKDSKATTGIAPDVWVDGKRSRGEPMSDRGEPNIKSTTSGFRISKDEIRPFLFSTINFTDDERYMNDLSKHLGSIKIRIIRCTIADSGSNSDSDLIFADPSDLPDQPIHERQGKAMIHQVGVGPSTQVRSGPWVTCSDKVKVVDFIFKYRTLNQLIAMCVAPPQPKNKRKAVENDNEAKLSQSNTKHVEKKIKKEEKDGNPTPSSSASHSSSQIQVEDDPIQQQTRPRPSPQLESSEDVHDTKCGVCESGCIRGIRYRCIVCPDFDTCSSCFETVGAEHPRHLFAKIQVSDYIEPKEIKGPKHSARCANCNRQIYGVRYKCVHTDCPDYNLCEVCDALPEPVHPLDHSLLKIRVAS